MGDLPLLMEHFIRIFNTQQGRTIAHFSPEAFALLRRHRFPGNVREVENIIAHAFSECEGEIIEIEHLPPRFHAGAVTARREKPRHTLDEIIKTAILQVLRRHRGNQSLAAQELAIDRVTLYRKIKALGIKMPDRDPRRG